VISGAGRFEAIFAPSSLHQEYEDLKGDDMKGQAALTSSAKNGGTDIWGTPSPFYQHLNEEFCFDLDPCASEENAKCDLFFDEAMNGLRQPWGKRRVFVNFPYSQAKPWAEKCVEEAADGSLVVVLCAARTDTAWFQLLARYAYEIRFIRGRLAFTSERGATQSATFPSAVVVLRRGLFQDSPGSPRCMFWDVPTALRRERAFAHRR
jgi:phage N-6-adenine-methyltransferase